MDRENNQRGDTAVSSFYPPQPAAEMAILRQALSTLGTEQTFNPRDEIYFVQENTKSLYLFSEGNFTFVRANDGLIITSIGLDMVYGLAECLQPRNGFFLRVEDPCKARVIPAEQAFEVFTRQQLWEPVAYILAWFLQSSFSREEHLVGVTAYVKVRTKLLELYSQPPDIRSEINVADYIQERTQLARSTIMAILGELRRGDYIVIKRGKLVEIKHLPKEY